MKEGRFGAKLGRERGNKSGKEYTESNEKDANLMTLLYLVIIDMCFRF